MVMPYIPNGTSVKYVRNWNEFEIKRFLKQTANYTTYIHYAIQDYRDIKPENVLVMPVISSPLTSALGSIAQTLRKSAAGNANSAGTLAFMPPDSRDLNKELID